MEYLIQGRHPAAMFRYFEELCAIPHGSGNEKAVSDMVCRIAEEHGLAWHQDTLYNVIVKKPGSKGCEALPPIMLQGHLDMVCEKNIDCPHDFGREGLKLELRDGYLFARGTTLGADNGAAVAMMLAILTDDTLLHPPLECVFTAQEETGLIGAAALDGKLLSARTMINLDSEEEGVATVSCAGGLRMRFVRTVEHQPASGVAMRVRIGGLQGGHSGMDIDCGRENANKLLGTLLSELATPFAPASVNGGNKENAIPREAEAVLIFSDEAAYQATERELALWSETRKQALLSAEPQFVLYAEQAVLPETIPDQEGMTALVRLLCEAPNGVLSRNERQGGFVESSVNLGVVRTTEEEISAVFSPRSSVATKQEETKARLMALGEELGFGVTCTGEYPGWSYAEASPIRERFAQSYRRLFGQELRFESIHAGLECGLFADKLPGLDAIAVGPTILGCHTPEERLDLGSFERSWELIVDVLERMAEEPK